MFCFYVVLVLLTSEASWLRKSQGLTVTSGGPTRWMRHPQLGCLDGEVLLSLCKRGEIPHSTKQGKEESEGITSARPSHDCSEKNALHAVFAARFSPIASHSLLLQPFHEKLSNTLQQWATEGSGATTSKRLACLKKGPTLDDCSLLPAQVPNPREKIDQP